MNVRCRILGHKFCKCGWCIRHPICRRCFYDKVCNTKYGSLRDAMKCQHQTYNLLEIGRSYTNES